MSRMNDPMQSQGQSSTEQSSGVAQNLRDMGQQVKEKAQEQFETLRQSASEYYEQGRDKAMEWEHNVEDYIREQPMKSVLIAAGVGLVLGFIWRRM